MLVMVDGTIRTCNLQVPITLNLRPHECARGKGRQGKWPKPPIALPLSYIHRNPSAGCPAESQRCRSRFRSDWLHSGTRVSSRGMRWWTAGLEPATTRSTVGNPQPSARRQARDGKGILVLCHLSYVHHDVPEVYRSAQHRTLIPAWVCVSGFSHRRKPPHVPMTNIPNEIGWTAGLEPATYSITLNLRPDPGQRAARNRHSGESL